MTATRLRPSLIVTLLILTAALIGLGVTRDARLGAVAIGGMVFATFLLVDLPVAIGLWVVALYLAGVPGTKGAPTGTSVLLLAGWAATLVNRAPHLRASTRWAQGAYAITGLLMLWSAASMLWARDPAVVTGATLDLGIAAAALPVLVTSCTRVRDALVVAGAFVAGATTAVIAGVLTGSTAVPADPAAAQAAAGRLNVGITDPNYLAADIVASLALVLGLLGVRGLGRWRLVLLASVPVLLYGLVATQSRGGIIAATVAAILAAVLLRRHRRRIVAAIGVAVALLAAFLAAQPRAVERLTQDDATGTGRTDIWRVAWAVARDHLIGGVGTGNFRVVESSYAGRVGFLERPGLIVDTPLVSHNIWLQALVENGIPGLLLLLAVVVVTVGASLRASRSFADRGRDDLAEACRGLAVGQLGSLTASMFIANANDRVFWVLLALGPTLLALSKRPVVDQPSPRATSGPATTVSATSQVTPAAASATGDHAVLTSTGGRGARRAPLPGRP